MSAARIGQKKAEQFSRSDCPSERASRHPALWHLFGDVSAAKGSTSELLAKGSRQIEKSNRPRVGWLMLRLAERACVQQSGWPNNSHTNGSGHYKAAASSQQPLGSCLSDTFAVFCVAFLLAPHYEPRWQITNSILRKATK